MMRKKDQTVKAIKQIVTNQSELKTRQFVGGDDVLGYFTDSGAAYDLAVSLPAAGNAAYLLTFTPTHTTYSPIVELFGYATIDNPNVLSSWQLLVGAVAQYNLDIQKISPTQWRLAMYNQDGGAAHTTYCKFIFSGTDSGTFAAVAV